ncbi:MAG TPA: insulinase family protein, partial [Vicinamibacterales bacterium]
NALAKEWMPDRNRVVTISAPAKEGFAVPDEKTVAALIAVAGKNVTAYVDTVDEAPLLETPPAPGAVVKSGTKDALGITEWQLSNGVKVVLKPTTFREDEIVFRATSFGGSSLASDADYHSASAATSVVGAGGLGRFSAVDLRKKMTGKTASASAFISEHEEGLLGSSSKKDLETLFQLIYLRFTQPRIDAEAFEAMQSQQRSMLQNMRNNPSFLFSEALIGALYGNHPRRQTPSIEAVEAVNLEKAAAFYKDRFADAGDFTFVFVGSFDEAAMKPLVERYLGGLPAAGRKETWKDTGVRYTKGTVERRVEKGLEPQSRTALVFTGPFEYTAEQRVAIRAMADVLGTRLHEKLREDLGGTYGVNASASYSRIPEPEYSVNISFGSAPERADGLVKAAFEEIDLLKMEGPNDKQLNDVKAKLLRDIETNMKSNAYLRDQLSLRYQAGDDPATLFAIEESYKALTAKAIQDAAKRYLDPANVVKVSLFPEKK